MYDFTVNKQVEAIRHSVNITRILTRWLIIIQLANGSFIE